MLHSAVPLAKRSSSVTSFFEYLTDHYLIGIHAFTTLRSGIHAAANVMPSSEKLCTRWRTDWTDIKVLKPGPVFCQSINMGCLDRDIPVDAQVSPSLVIGKNHNDIRLICPWHLVANTQK